MTSTDKKLLEEFGFVDKNGLADNKQLKKALKSSPSTRSQKYDYKWRLKLMKSYFSYYISIIKINIEKYHKDYEDYLIRNSGNFSDATAATAEISKQIGYLTDNRGNPWEIKPHRGKRIWYIKDPHRNFWFRALNNNQLLQAIRIIRTQYSSRFPPTKPKLPDKGTYKLKLNYNKCKASFNNYKNKGALWMKRDWFVALMICRNIISTWDTRTGDWKPWNNKWCRIAHKRPGITINKYKLRDGKVEYNDIAKFVMSEGLGGMAKGAYIAGVAFAVGGGRASKIITSFCRDNKIPLYKIRR